MKLKYTYALIGTEINDTEERPIITAIGPNAIDIKWELQLGGKPYVIKCHNVSTLESKVYYSLENQYSFNDMNEKDLYEFQVTVPKSNGTNGVWTPTSYQVLPNTELGRVAICISYMSVNLNLILSYETQHSYLSFIRDTARHTYFKYCHC